MADDDYPVGYGRPPKHTQFQKGQSGNPKGRPKGKLNLATVLERELNQKVTIKERGRSRTITKLEAAVKQQVNKAAGGDTKAMQFLVGLQDFVRGQGLPLEATAIPYEEDGQAIAALLRTLEVGPIAGEVDDAHQS